MSEKKSSAAINIRAFASALIVIATLMALTFILTKALPCEGISVTRWLASPFLQLGAEGSATIIAVIIFLLVIGGIFSCLEACGLMRYMLDTITHRFAASRYRLMAVMILFFMALGALVGSFEECVPMVPIVTALAVRLGWDRKTGIAMSMLAVGCGFASGVLNPFTVGVAQGLCGLPMFSGAWFRLIAFALIYALLLFFVRRHAKKVDAGVREEAGTDFVREPQKERGLRLFAGILGFGMLLVLSSAVIAAIRDYTLIIVAIAFLAAGIAACAACGMGKAFFPVMGKGAVSLLPAALMVLMASSIRYTLETAGALDVILAAAVDAANTMPRFAVILFIYLIVLVMNFFVASGSAKAMMLIPLIVPLAEPFGISAQLCIVAFAFGDGFSNVFYPTNPALLISLGLGGESYGDWFRCSWKFQLANLALTSGMLLLGLVIGV